MTYKYNTGNFSFLSKSCNVMKTAMVLNVIAGICLNSSKLSKCFLNFLTTSSSYDHRLRKQDQPHIQRFLVVVVLVSIEIFQSVPQALD